MKELFMLLTKNGTTREWFLVSAIGILFGASLSLATDRDTFAGCSPREVSAIVEKDLANLAGSKKANARYLSFYHLNCLNIDERQRTKNSGALQKLVNSLNWSPELQLLPTIDEEKSIFRVDLGKMLQLQTDGTFAPWTAELWNKIVAAEPYDRINSGSAKFVRADWFVNNASRAPLYEILLGTQNLSPDKVAGFLGVKLDENLKKGEALRAGILDSGVSQNNRVIERHPTKYGAFWRSFDFSSSLDQRNIFANPFGPNLMDKNAFRFDGGEFIFNLPNGLQAYMLTTASGLHLDKGPIEIVSDPSQPDRKVANAISCMRCHSNGIIEVPDQIGPYVNSLNSRFSVQQRNIINLVYQDNNKLLGLMASDQKRFATALTALGIENKRDDVNAVAAEYQKSIGLNAAAIELGVPVEKFLAEIAGTVAEAPLSPLSEKNGLVKRTIVEQLLLLIPGGIK